MNKFMEKWGLTFKVLVIVFFLLIIKILIGTFNLDVATASPLITALVGGVIFTIAIIFTGTLTDYKESEKIPGELAASLKALYKDSTILRVDEKIVEEMRLHVKDFLKIIISNFKQNTWKLDEIETSMEKINEDIIKLSEKGAAPQFLVKLRTELINIDKLSNRIHTITGTTFIPAAYGIAELAVAAVLLVLMFVRTDPYYEGLALIGATSSLLIGLILLIRDMDDPFEVGNNSYADVDLEILFGLEKYLE